MKIITTTILIAMAVAMVSSANADDTNRQSRAQCQVEDEIRYADKLRKMGLHEYADVSVSGRGPSLVKQATEAIRFEEFLIENWGNKKKIEGYLHSHGNGHTQLYWLLRLRLAEHHWMHGEKKESLSITDSFAQHLRESEDRRKTPGEVQHNPGP
jgi:hypothetical protein